MAQTITFSNGNKMPLIGLGTWLSTDAELLENAVDEALESGYRHIDTAFVYGNEKIIGNVLKRWIDEGKIKREELFITTKLPPNGVSLEKVEHFLQKSLNNLQLTYVDLYLIHSPVGCLYISDDNLFSLVDGKFQFDATTNLEAVWKAMEEQVNEGKAKSIGVSNFSPKQLERIAKVARIQPANIQVELSAYFQQEELRATCDKLGVTLCAYAAFGSPGRAALFAKQGREFEDIGLLDNPLVAEIAEKHDKTAAQVLAKFLVQQGIVVIPKSVTPERIRKNIQIFDFELSPEDMTKLENLDRGFAGRTFNFSGMDGAKQHPEFPYDDVL